MQDLSGPAQTQSNPHLTANQTLYVNQTLIISSFEQNIFIRKSPYGLYCILQTSIESHNLNAH